jgi:AAA+ ATPase superfamily predicted ATPase
MFIGREDELNALDALWGRDSGVLVTCRGRRRIGKSTLIEEFAARTSDRFIAIEGLPPRKGVSDADQRRHFCEMVAEYAGRDYIPAATWSIAFAQLNEIIPNDARTVVLLDEISWLGDHCPDFPGYLKAAWDKRLRKHPNLIMVLCGSVSTWIAENILDSTGFVGRDSLDLEIKELSLSDSVKMLGPSAERLSSGELLDMFSITGGVPKYIEEIKPQISADENIRRMCFLPRSLLFREFDDVFSAVLGRRAESRGRILRMLADGPKSASELAAREGTAQNGAISQALKDLCLAGFAVRESGLNPETGKPLRLERYRICDNYARFYLHAIEPRKTAIENGLFRFSSLEQLPGWDALLGLQFENLILSHIPDLFSYLGLDNSLVLSASPFVRKAGAGGRGVQVDLLIQTRRSLMVVEIKRRREIETCIVDEVLKKAKTLRKMTDASIRTALVYDGHLAKSIPADGFFDFILPASKLLGRD